MIDQYINDLILYIKIYYNYKIEINDSYIINNLYNELILDINGLTNIIYHPIKKEFLNTTIDYPTVLNQYKYNKNYIPQSLILKTIKSYLELHKYNFTLDYKNLYIYIFTHIEDSSKSLNKIPYINMNEIYHKVYINNYPVKIVEDIDKSFTEFKNVLIENAFYKDNITFQNLIKTYNDKVKLEDKLYILKNILDYIDITNKKTSLGVLDLTQQFLTSYKFFYRENDNDSELKNIISTIHKSIEAKKKYIKYKNKYKILKKILKKELNR